MKNIFIPSIVSHSLKWSARLFTKYFIDQYLKSKQKSTSIMFFRNLEDKKLSVCSIITMYFHTCILSVLFRISVCMLRDFSTCHDDFNLKPPDGILKEHTFSWLGFVQYLHGKLN